MENMECNIFPSEKTKKGKAYYLPVKELNMPFANEDVWFCK